jgi:hypothetical protein
MAKQLVAICQKAHSKFDAVICQLKTEQQPIFFF